MNPVIALMQLEQINNVLQNKLVDEDGKLTVDIKYIELFDEVMDNLEDTRKLLHIMKKNL